jgi:recombination protein RecA
MKIGVVFGSPETTSGGNALKFYASVRLDVRRIGAIKDTSGKDPVIVGNRTRVKVAKNKMAPPFREVEFDILYGKGISRSGEIVDKAVDEGFLQKSGAWYSMGSERVGQGRENARTYLEEHPDVMEKLATQIMENAGFGVDPVEKKEVRARPQEGQEVSAEASETQDAQDGKSAKADGKSGRSASKARVAGPN